MNKCKQHHIIGCEECRSKRKSKPPNLTQVIKAAKAENERLQARVQQLEIQTSEFHAELSMRTHCATDGTNWRMMLNNLTRQIDVATAECKRLMEMVNELVVERDKEQARVRELEGSAKQKGLKNLLRAVENICPTCGHSKTEDGCPHCLKARVAELDVALRGLINDPYGCPMCDSGRLRDQAKGHWPECPYPAALSALKGGAE